MKSVHSATLKVGCRTISYS